MQKVLRSSYTILIISISTPLLIGVYRDDILIETISSNQKTSEVLLKILTELSVKYSYKKLLYTNGPGSYMAIKLTYITLRSLEILKGISFFGCNAFDLNANKPIKAMGKLYFIKENNTIITEKIDEAVEQRFELPSLLSDVTILNDNRPLYILPAV